MPMHLSSRKLVLKWRVGSFGRATMRLHRAGQQGVTGCFKFCCNANAMETANYFQRCGRLPMSTSGPKINHERQGEISTVAGCG